MLTKVAARKHQQACEILAKANLTLDEKWFVIEHFHEAGEGNNRRTSAHFTPWELARDLAININDDVPILDLCAGIGTLSFAYRHTKYHDEVPTITCVEINPRYVEVGRQLMPEAEWICGDIFDPKVQERLRDRNYRFAIGNPPFGKQALHGRKAPRYQGPLFEYAVIDVASDLADHGVFIIPQGSAPFLFSGMSFYQDGRRPLRGDPNTGQLGANMQKYRPFREATGIDLDIGVSIDTSPYQTKWRGVAPAVEIVAPDFEEARARRLSNATSDKQLSFALAG